ncbi:MAG: NAD(P)-dependent alcohol dehydrogenase, partial [Gaiellales bacterium]
MKALVQTRYGAAAEVLRLDEIDVPEPAAGEVLIRVEAAGLGMHVWHMTTGRPLIARAFGGLRKPRAAVPRSDVAGVVEALGPGVTELGVGNAVYGVAVGALADYACARVDELAPKPVSLTFAEAAAIPVSGCAALHGLRDVGRIEAGQHVLVLGASGGVGTFAVQLAKAFGAEVTGVCSGVNLNLVKLLGADHVLDYTSDDVASGRDRYDLILDLAGRRPLRQLRRSLTPHGTVAIVGGEGGGPIMGGFQRAILWAPLLSLVTRQRMRPVISDEHSDDLQVLTELVDAGHLTPIVNRAVRLEEAVQALADLRVGHGRGK